VQTKIVLWRQCYKQLVVCFERHSSSRPIEYYHQQQQSSIYTTRSACAYFPVDKTNPAANVRALFVMMSNAAAEDETINNMEEEDDDDCKVDNENSDNDDNVDNNDSAENDNITTNENDESFDLNEESWQRQLAQWEAEEESWQQLDARWETRTEWIMENLAKVEAKVKEHDESLRKKVSTWKAKEKEAGRTLEQLETEYQQAVARGDIATACTILEKSNQLKKAQVEAIEGNRKEIMNDLQARLEEDDSLLPAFEKYFKTSTKLS